MFAQMDWLDTKLHPKLQLDGESIELAYQPVATDHGPVPYWSLSRLNASSGITQGS